MELKYIFAYQLRDATALLIAPYGIEMGGVSSTVLDVRLLIAPYGIEIAVGANHCATL